MAQSESKKSPNKHVWFLDFGCSNHMCDYKDWFYDLDENFRTTVKLGDNSRMTIIGKDSIKLEMEAKIGGVTCVI